MAFNTMLCRNKLNLFVYIPMNCVVVGRVVEVVDAIGVVVVGVVDGVVDANGVVVFKDWGFEFEKAKVRPRPTPANTNMIDNDARINLLTMKKSRYLSSIHRYYLDNTR